MEAGKHENANTWGWEAVETPGYMGPRKPEFFERWDREYGPGNWQFGWEMATGELMDYDQMLDAVFVDSYEAYFRRNPGVALWITNHFSHVYDKVLTTYEQAMDPHSQYDDPEVEDQIHDKAIMCALVERLGLTFKGTQPLQARGPDTPGWFLSPGLIPVCRPEWIAEGERLAGWWDPRLKSIEQAYQEGRRVYARILPVEQ